MKMDVLWRFLPFRRLKNCHQHKISKKQACNFVKNCMANPMQVFPSDDLSWIWLNIVFADKKNGEISGENVIDGKVLLNLLITYYINSKNYLYLSQLGLIHKISWRIRIIVSFIVTTDIIPVKISLNSRTKTDISYHVLIVFLFCRNSHNICKNICQI